MDKKDNLVPFTKENAVTMGRMGGIASAEAKKEQKTLREQAREALYLPVNDEALAKKLVDAGLENNYASLIIFNVFTKAGKNAMMARVLLELLGELKSQSTEITVNNTVETEAYERGWRDGSNYIIDHVPDDVLRKWAWEEEGMDGDVGERKRDPKFITEVVDYCNRLLTA